MPPKLGIHTSPPAPHLPPGEHPAMATHTHTLSSLSQGASEQQLRLCLWHCLTLSRVWPPSLLPVTAAWDYFYRHMVRWDGMG